MLWAPSEIFFLWHQTLAMPENNKEEHCVWPMRVTSVARNDEMQMVELSS